MDTNLIPVTVGLTLSNPSCGTSQIHSENAQGIIHQHTLNREKQTSKLIENASRPAIDIEVNCNDENVNINCSPGFYTLVARPCLLNISVGHQITCEGTTFELKSITPQKDLSGITQTTILKFIFMKELMEYSVTISLHHTTQKIQIQGSSSMSDGSKVATFILNRYLADLFRSKSLEQKENVDSFNSALTTLGLRRAGEQRQQNLQISSNRCSVCNGDLSKNNSKTVPCINLGCSAQTHSKCFRKHACPYSTSSRKRNIGMTSFLALDDDSPPTTSSQQPTISPPVSSSPASASLITASTCFVSSIPSIPPVQTSSTMSTKTSSTFIFTPSASISSVSFNSAPSSSEPLGPMPVILQRALTHQSKKAKPNPNPELVKIEYLKKELVIAQTKISTLENEVKRKEETCKILEERIKSLEHPAMSNLLNQYLPKAHTTQESSDSSCSSYPLLEKLAGDLGSLQGQVTVLQELVIEVSENLQAAQNTRVDQEQPAIEPSQPSILPNHSDIQSLQSKSMQQVASPESGAGIAPAPTSLGPGQGSDCTPPSLPCVEPSARTPRRRPKKRNKNQHPWQAFKAPRVSIQPWLSSSVWDHGPTISLSQLPIRSRQPNQAGHLKRHRTQDQLRNRSSSTGGKKADKVSEHVRSSWSARFPESSQQPLNNISPQPGQVLDAVRSAWTKRYPQPNQSPSQLN